MALDRVCDPHNLGAVLRTAAFLGCNGVLLPSSGTAPLSPAVAHVSSGAMDLLLSQVSRSCNLIDAG